MTTKLIGIAAAIVALAAAAWWWLGAPKSTSGSRPATSSSSKVDLRTPIVSSMHKGADRARAKDPSEIVVPALSPVAKDGEVAFLKYCSACHGVNAAGTNKGPPLIHSLYRPGHHPDAAIVSAARNGVRAHHWRFGNMPPVSKDLSDAKLRWIIKYLREMQRANGIK